MLPHIIRKPRGRHECKQFTGSIFVTSQTRQQMCSHLLMCTISLFCKSPVLCSKMHMKTGEWGHFIPAMSNPRTLLPAWWVEAAAALSAELLPDEQSRDARGFRERKRKVKAHNTMRERSNMPPALPPPAGMFNMPTFGCRENICVTRLPDTSADTDGKHGSIHFADVQIGCLAVETVPAYLGVLHKRTVRLWVTATVWERGGGAHIGGRRCGQLVFHISRPVHLHGNQILERLWAERKGGDKPPS